jgi:hypothetical protein
MQATGISGPRTSRALPGARAIRTLTCIAGLLASLIGTASADPLTTHPRMWVTASDLPKLRSWAVNPNPMYKNGLAAAAAQAKTNADAAWNWTTGTPNLSKWQDDGSSSYVFDCTEAYAEMFAFMSLVDPVVANRKQWASHARIMLMWEINQAALGTASGQPFRDPTFPSYNRANYWGEAFPLIVDWIYSTLTSTDKAQIRKVFMAWDNTFLTVSTAGNEHPQPLDTLNSIKLLGNDSTQSAYTQQQAQLQLRWAANNFNLGHARLMAMTAMSMDAADDPLVNTHKSALAVGNSLRSYYAEYSGAWLYQTYSLFEDAATVRTALKLPKAADNISLGIASAGPPVESSLYGESQGFIGMTMLAMRTAGYDDTAQWGPQVGLFSSAYWDRAIDGLIHSLAPAPFTPGDATYLGKLWPISSHGDILRAFAEPDSTLTLAATVGLADARAGNNPTRLAKARWIARYVPEGGDADSFFYDRAANVWGNSDASISILYYLLFDPKMKTEPDPRPAMSTKFASPPSGIIDARTDWTTTSTWFTFRCGWESINHQSGDCGQFELHRKGTWLTKEWGNYANDGNGYTSLYHNVLGIQNRKVTDVPDLYARTYLYGSQWNNGGNDGDPSVLLSVNDNWAYALTDATNLYNHPNFYTPANNAMAVKSAVRSIAWIAPDAVVVYDRATTSQAKLFKQFNLVLLAAPKISGKIATATSGGQKLTVQSLLPEDATITEQHFWKTDPSQEMDLVAQYEPSRDRLVIADPAMPADTRFLTLSRVPMRRLRWRLRLQSIRHRARRMMASLSAIPSCCFQSPCRNP